MVNKAFLSLTAVVLFAVFGIGVFVGMQVDGGPAGAPDAGQGAIATPAGTDTPATATPASTPTPSENDGDRTTEREEIPPREFNERNISAAIVEDINDARVAEGLERLSDSGTTADRVRRMAENHSDAMADAGLTSHTIDGVDSADRYQQNDLYQSCEFNVNGNYIENADDNGLEVVGETVAGQTYTVDGTEQFNANETAVAAALTDEWLSTSILRDRLLVPDAGQIGVGVTVNNRGTVYATVNLCG
ncbi:CAP domain-containing protein [Halobacteriales archaeon QS_6_64_34]|nr:MAG: CAP domain-containing protein [Halobacteriales archaeon QS_6_64_34]